MAKAQPGASGSDAALGFGCAAALSSCELRYGAWKAQQVTGELQQVECHLAVVNLPCGPQLYGRLDVKSEGYFLVNVASWKGPELNVNIFMSCGYVIPYRVQKKTAIP